MTVMIIILCQGRTCLSTMTMVEYDVRFLIFLITKQSDRIEKRHAGLRNCIVFFWHVYLGKDDISKTDEILEKFQTAVSSCIMEDIYGICWSSSSSSKVILMESCFKRKVQSTVKKSVQRRNMMTCKMFTSIEYAIEECEEKLLLGYHMGRPMVIDHGSCMYRNATKINQTMKAGE